MDLSFNFFKNEKVLSFTDVSPTNSEEVVGKPGVFRGGIRKRRESRARSPELEEATRLGPTPTSIPQRPWAVAEMSPPRRLAVLCSHLRPDGPAPPAGEHSEAAAGVVSTSTCASGGGAAAGGDGVGVGDSAGYVFCRIIRGEAPAYKVKYNSAARRQRVRISTIVQTATVFLSETDNLYNGLSVWLSAE
jgi:hypothetical protein